MNHSQEPRRRDTEDPILAALGQLRREDASPDFTRRVLERVAAGRTTPREAAPTAGGAWPAWRWSVAVAVLLTTAVGAAAWERQRERREMRGRLDALVEEHRSLQRALDDLRASESSQFYLGGDDDHDVVLDLSAARPIAAAGRPGAGAPVTSTHRNGGTT